MAHEFDYAVIRVVPRVDRDEFINVGVIVYCRALDFLEARLGLDRDRLAALYPAITSDLDEIERALAIIPRLCAGDPALGPLSRLSQAERFHWLVAPKSTITQTSPVHVGLCDDPASMIEHLMDRMVKVTPYEG